MKKIIGIVFGVLLVFGGVGYFVLPTTINWEKYTQEMSVDVKKMTGRDLVIQGKPAFSLRPIPVLKLTQVTLKNANGTVYPNMLVVPQIEIVFDAGALFKRQIKIKKVTMTTPEFYVEELRDGSLNWDFGFLRKETPQAKAGFEGLVVRNGSMLIKGDKYTPDQKGTNLNAEMFADSIQGPFFLEGNVSALSTNFGFSIKIDRLEAGRSPEFTARITNAVSETSLSFAGGYGAKSGEKESLEGSITLDMRKTDQAFALFYPKAALPKELFQPINGSFTFKKTPAKRLIEMNEILFQYGNSSATGKLVVEKADPAQIALIETKKQQEEYADEDEIVLIDPDAKQQVTITVSEAPITAESIAYQSLPKNINGQFVFSKFVADPFLKNIPAITDFLVSQSSDQSLDDFTYNLSFDTAEYNNDLMKQVKVTLNNQKGVLNIPSLTGLFPGATSLSTSGFLERQKEEPVFVGNIETKGENVGAFLRWVAVKMPAEIPQNLLRSFEAKSEFKISKTGFELQKTDLNVDDIKASGDLKVVLGTRLGLEIDAQVNELNIDAYFPEKRKTLIAKRGESANLNKKTGQKIKELFSDLAFLNELDLTLQIDADKVVWTDLRVEGVALDAQVLKGTLQLESFLVKDFLKASFDFSGEASGFGGEPHLANVAFQMNTTVLDNFLKFANITLPADLIRSGTLGLNGKVSGGIDAFEIDLSANFGVMDFSVSGNVRETPSGFNYSLDTKIKQDNFRNFTRLFTEKYRPISQNPGAFEFQGIVNKNDARFDITQVKAVIGSNAFVGSFKAEKNQERQLFIGEITSEDLDLTLLLPKMNVTDDASQTFGNKGFFANMGEKIVYSRTPLDFSFLGDFNADFKIKTAKLTLDTLVLNKADFSVIMSATKMALDVRSASWKDATLVVLGDIDVAEATPTLNLKMRLANLSSTKPAFESPFLDLMFGSFSFDASVTSTGKSIFELMEALAGKGNFVISDAVLQGVDLPSATEILSSEKLDLTVFEKQTQKGQTKLSSLTSPFTIAQNVINFSPIKIDYGNKSTQTSFLSYNVMSRQLDAQFDFKLSDLPDTVELTKKISGTITALKTTTNALEVFDSVAQLQERQTEDRQLALEKQKQERLQKIAQEKAKSVQKLVDLEQPVLLQKEDLQKKIEEVRGLADKIYQAQTYHVLMQKDLEKINTVLQEIRSLMDQEKILDPEIETLRQKIQSQILDKEAEMKRNYTVALTVGAKGKIADRVRESNDILILMVKSKATYPTLAEMQKPVDEVVKEIEALKEVQQKSETADDTMALTLLGAQAEGIFEKIKLAQAESQGIVLAEQERRKAQEQAKIDEANRLKQIEEEAKKEAQRIEEERKIEEQKVLAEKERLAEIERQKKLLDERERQRTIFRRDGIATQNGIASDLESQKPVFKLTPDPQENLVTDENPQLNEQKTGGIIRKR